LSLQTAERVLLEPARYTAELWYQAMCVVMAERASA
jgi:hypothetical protein